MAQHAYRTSWAVFAPARARSHLLGLGINCSPHTGHSIRSKSMRRTSAGRINLPHFGQTASSDACTFSRLTFLERGATGMLSPPKITNHRSLPCSCYRLYLAGAIYTFQVRIYCVGEAVLGEGCLRASLTGESGALSLFVAPCINFNNSAMTSRRLTCRTRYPSFSCCSGFLVCQ